MSKHEGSKDLFLEELRLEYSRELEIKTIMEGKANTIITITGIITPLVFGFGIGVFTEEVFQNLKSNSLFTIPLFLSIFANIISLLFSIRALRLHDFMVPLGHKIFYNGANQNIEEIDNYKNADPIVFKNSMIEEYLESLKFNSDYNQKRAFKINVAYWALLIGIGSFIFSLGFAFFNV